ncbi:MAG: Holliday junction branch migration protein RuvA [Proteobacteria bacterium]|nr:Holliday junction branch migration protein RuvA [Pseudomonadota bacterium]
MIARLKGTLAEKTAAAVVVMTGGVGYRVHVPLSTFYELPEEGAEVDLRVRTVVREDAIELFGFMTSAEKEVFGLLNSVSKIGPKLALNILSGISPAELVQAVSQKDLGRLSRVPGVGTKTAERLVLELKDKLPQLAALAPVSAPAAGMAELDDIGRDLVSALINLGYSRNEAQKAVTAARAEADCQGDDLAGLLRLSLKRLQKT